MPNVDDVQREVARRRRAKMRAIAIVMIVTAAAGALSFMRILPLTPQFARLLAAIGIFAVALGCFGPRALQSKSFVDDERDRFNRNQAMALGFWVLLTAALGALVGSIVDIGDAASFVMFAMEAGVVAAIWRYGVLDRAGER